MNARQAIIAALIAKPGMTMRDVSAATGQTGTTAVSAHLSQLCAVRKLRRDDTCPPRYWPTALATIDLRKKVRTPAQIETLRQTSLAREAQRRAAKHDAPKLKRTAAPAERVIEPRGTVDRDPAPQLAKPLKAHGETIADFQKRGGLIEKLPPNFSSNPLRFDHSNGTALNKPHRRALVAAAP